jgi:hypothetical protein
MNKEGSILAESEELTFIFSERFVGLRIEETLTYGLNPKQLAKEHESARR